MTEIRDARPRFCRACGTELTPGDAFCASCGAAVREGPPTGEQPAVPRDEPTGVMPAATEPAAVAAGGDDPPATRRRSVGLDVWLLVAGLAVAAIGGYLLTKSDGETISTAVGEGDEAPPALDYDGAGAGATDPASPTAPAASPTGEGAAGSLATCSNSSLGYSLSYPSEWYTASNGPRQDCRFFHTEPFTVTNASEPDATMFVFPIPTSYEEAVAGFEGPGLTPISRQDTTVGGRTAVQIEFGYSDADQDYLGYVYVVDHDGDALLFGANNEHATDYEAAKDVVDGVAATMTFP